MVKSKQSRINAVKLALNPFRVGDIVGSTRSFGIFEIADCTVFHSITIDKYGLILVRTIEQNPERYAKYQHQNIKDLHLLYRGRR